MDEIAHESFTISEIKECVRDQLFCSIGVTVTYSGVYQHKLQEHRKIIDQYAAEGWRYVDHIPVHQYAHGQYGAIDLVFERDVEE